ncbi:MAG: hypothetical protein WCT45_01410 [Candidatus Paceibacterota bacterium]|jgi:endonuclease/exonuclease/phosphatase family metal-dependent hydrolase
MTLNAGRLLQQRTRDFLELLAAGKMPRPDVLCLQDIAFRDLALLEWAPHVAFAPMTNHLINGERAAVGVAVVSPHFMTGVTYHTTWGDGVLKNLEGVNGQSERIAPTAENDRKIEATEDRVAICAAVRKDGVYYDVATTHGFWVRGGIANDQQYESTRALGNAVIAEACRRRGIVLAADMNMSRGGEIHQILVGRQFRDCMPPEIVSTLDPNHPAAKKGLRVVTDYVLTHDGHTGSTVYRVASVLLLPGISDHCAVVATVEKGVD